MYFMYMIITDLFDIDIHIFTVIKFLFNLVVKFKYIIQIYFIICRWYFMYMIITDLFDIDIHIFTVIKFLFNLVVKFKYINIYEKRRFILLFVDDTLCTW